MSVTASQMSARRRSRTVRLIEAALAAGLSPSRLCRLLDIGPEHLADIRAGRRRLRFVKRVLLAAIVEAHLPSLARDVANLRAELAAVLSYRDRVATRAPETDVVLLEERLARSQRGLA